MSTWNATTSHPPPAALGFQTLDAADHGCSQRYFCPRKSEKWRTLKFLDFNILWFLMNISGTHWLISKRHSEEVLEPNPSVAVMVHYEVRVGWLWVCEHPDFGYEWKTYQEPQSLVTSKIKSAIRHPILDIFEFPRFDSASSGQKIDPPNMDPENLNPCEDVMVPSLV